MHVSRQQIKKKRSWMCYRLNRVSLSARITKIHISFCPLLCTHTQTVSQLPNSRQLALASLQQQLEEAIQKEATSTEEKIRNYALEQYQILEKFRDRSHLDHRVLARYKTNYIYIYIFYLWAFFAYLWSSPAVAADHLSNPHNDVNICMFFLFFRQVCDRKEAEKPSDNSSRENLTNDSNLVTSSFNETPQVTLSNDMMVVNGSDLKSQIVSKQIANDRRVVSYWKKCTPIIICLYYYWDKLLFIIVFFIAE